MHMRRWGVWCCFPFGTAASRSDRSGKTEEADEKKDEADVVPSGEGAEGGQRRRKDITAVVQLARNYPDIMTLVEWLPDRRGSLEGFRVVAQSDRSVAYYGYCCGAGAGGGGPASRRVLAGILATPSDQLAQVRNSDHEFSMNMLRCASISARIKKPAFLIHEVPERPACEPSGRKCWHMITVTPFMGRLAAVVQTDVTDMMRYEQDLSRLADMLATMLPSHVIEALMNKQHDAATPTPTATATAMQATMQRKTIRRNTGSAAAALASNSSNGVLLINPGMDSARSSLDINRSRDSLPTVFSPTSNGTARLHADVTVMFMDVVGFTTMADTVAPCQVMAFLNELFSGLDDMLAMHHVHKVETAGDCYIVAAGVLDEPTPRSHLEWLSSVVRTSHSDSGNDSGSVIGGFIGGFIGGDGGIGGDGIGGIGIGGDGGRVQHQHSAGACGPVAREHDPVVSAYRVMSFARDAIAHASTVRMPDDGRPTRVRIGLHTGPVVSGLIGHRLPKFGLFGDTMNVASRMEQTAPVCCIQVSQATRDLLRDDAFEPTGGVPIKGKGVLMTHVWRPPSPLLGGGGGSNRR